MINRMLQGGAVAALAAVVLLWAACEVEREIPEHDPAVVPPPGAEVVLPDTTPEGLWRYLEEIDYADSWSHWPRLPEFYPGTEPHGQLLRTYANGIAMPHIEAGLTGDLPHSSMIVKENYTEGRELDSYSVMWRIEEYNPEHRDWLFAKYGPDGVAEEFGRVESCQECHAGAETGYIHTRAPR